MKFVSTSGSSPAVSFRQALVDGLAPDGGLYVPETIPRIGAWGRFRDAPIAEIAAVLLAPYAEDLVARDRLGELMRDALPFDAPLAALGDGIHLAELFHGPTLAFKDFGARSLARLLVAANDGAPLTVLVATSGDTGGAVAHAFFGLERVRVVVLYPRGGVSRLQEAQFATLGGNVTACAVDGTFDDCQRLVKRAFAEPGMSPRFRLTSANSINVGRLLPQMAYYARAAAQLPEGAGPPVFVTPSGNFGNLVAGLMAQRMGLSVARFVGATNANDVVPSYLSSGRYAARPSVATISNAMDVGAPSNVARLLHLYETNLAAIRRDVAGVAVSDETTRGAIRDVFTRTGVVVDPHTAVGVAGLAVARARGDVDPDAPAIVLSTAHPAKFAETVEPLIGRPIEIPRELAERLEAPNLAVPLRGFDDLERVLAA
jgi:threonine synthase